MEVAGTLTLFFFSFLFYWFNFSGSIPNHGNILACGKKEKGVRRMDVVVVLGSGCMHNMALFLWGMGDENLTGWMGGGSGDMHHESWRLGWSISLFFVCLCFEGWEVAFALRWRRGDLSSEYTYCGSTHLLSLVIVVVIVVVHCTE